MLEMANELVSLRATFNSLRNSPASDVLQTSLPVASPVLQPQFHAGLQPKSPMSLVFQPPFVHSRFDDDSLNACNIQPHQRTASTLVNSSALVPPPEGEVSAERVTEHIIQTVTPDPSPHHSLVDTSTIPPSSSGKHAKRKRERMPSVCSSNGNSSSTSSSSTSLRRRKRTNHHDTRCYTIHVSFL